MDIKKEFIKSKKKMAKIFGCYENSDCKKIYKFYSKEQLEQRKIFCDWYIPTHNNEIYIEYYLLSTKIFKNKNHK